MEFGKLHDTTDTVDICLHQFVTDLSFMLWTCYGEVATLLWTFYGETDVMDFGLIHAPFGVVWFDRNIIEGVKNAV